MKPTFVRVFQVLSGSITPSEVGLIHPTQVQQLLKIAKWLPLLRKNNITIVPFTCALGVFGIHFYGLGFISSIIRFIYPAISSSLWSYYVFNLLSFQIFLFFILCKYFLIKLKEKNRLLREEKRMNPNTIRYILRAFDVLYREINEYNSTYWSKFLLNIWSLLGIFIVCLLYLCVFGSIPILIRLSAGYFLILYVILYLFILSIASSVNSEANKSYKIFNSFIIKFHNTSELDSRRLFINIMKVIFIIIIIKNFINFNFILQLNTIIERLAKRNIGFTCWLLFTVNYFKFYEVNICNSSCCFSTRVFFL